MANSASTSLSQKKVSYGSLDKINRTDSDISHHHSFFNTGSSTICGVLGNFLNALVGSGVLAIPFVFQHAGLFGGLFLMVVFAIISVYTINLLIQAAQNYNVHEYEALGYVALGNTGYIAASACMFLMDFGSMLNYLIILGDASYKVIEIWGYDAFYDREVIIIAISALIIFPPCLFRDISFYEKFSAVKLFAMASVIIIVTYQYFEFRIFMTHKADGYDQKFMPAGNHMKYFDISGFGPALGVVAYCFVCHDTAFIYYNTLLNPTTKRWSVLASSGISLAMLLNLTFAVPAYFTFGSAVQGNVLNNYPVDAPSIIFTRCIYVITMALTYPTAFFVVRHVVCASFRKMVVLWQIWRYRKYRKQIMISGANVGENDFEADIQIYSENLYKNQYTVQNAPLWQHIIFTCLIFFVNLGLALWIDNLGEAMGIIGSLSSVNLAFVLPCICYVKSLEYGFLSFLTEKKTINKIRAWLAVYPPMFITIIGIFVVIYGTVTTVNQ